jgi:hypothetical protein
MKRWTPILAIYWLVLLSLAAATKVNLSNQASGILPVANAGTGSATTTATYSLAGPLSGAAAAYSFKSIPVTTPHGVSKPNTARISRMVISGAAPAPIQLLGMPGPIAQICDGGASAATSTLPTRCLGPAGGWPDAGWSLSGSLAVMTFGDFHEYEIYAALQRTTTFRITWGLQPGPIGACTAYDADCAAARFYACNNLGCTEANFKCRIKDTVGGTTSTADSGVPIDTNFHRFGIVSTGSAYNFFIDGTQVCSFASNLPSTSANAGPFAREDANFGDTGNGFYWSDMTIVSH